VAELWKGTGDDQPEVGTASPFTEPQKNKDNNNVKIVMINRNSRNGEKGKKKNRKAIKEHKGKRKFPMHEFGTLTVLEIFQGSNYPSPPRRPNDSIVGNLIKDVAGQPERGLSGEHPDYRRLKAAANIQSLRLSCGSHPFPASEA